MNHALADPQLSWMQILCSAADAKIGEDRRFTITTLSKQCLN